MLDRAAYFARIGYRGALAPAYDTLAAIVRAHVEAIPFENLDVLLGREVRLDLESVEAKLVGARRGGYCFEHATLLGALLRDLGFSTTAHAARVVLHGPREEAPRTHVFLTVPLPEGTFVIDPGFGVLGPRVPVPLRDGAVVEHGHEAHALVRRAGEWWLRARAGEEMVDAWVSSMSVELPIDLELANHWTSTHPRSGFVNRLMLRAVTPEGRVTVMNRDATIRRGCEARRWQLADRAELRALVREHFGFDLPEIERMRVPMVEGWS